MTPLLSPVWVDDPCPDSPQHVVSPGHCKGTSAVGTHHTLGACRLAHGSTLEGQSDAHEPRAGGVCRSCNARRMAEVAAHLTDEVLPHLPVRQWVLSLPKRLRPYLHHNPELAGAVLGVFLRAIRSTLREASPSAPGRSKLAALSFRQRLGSSVNLHYHYHVLALDVISLSPLELIERLACRRRTAVRSAQPHRLARGRAQAPFAHPLGSAPRSHIRGAPAPLSRLRRRDADPSLRHRSSSTAETGGPRTSTPHAPRRPFVHLVRPFRHLPICSGPPYPDGGSAAVRNLPRLSMSSAHPASYLGFPHERAFWMSHPLLSSTSLHGSCG